MIGGRSNTCIVYSLPEIAQRFDRKQRPIVRTPAPALDSAAAVASHPLGTKQAGGKPRMANILRSRLPLADIFNNATSEHGGTAGAHVANKIVWDSAIAVADWTAKRQKI